MKVKLAMGSVVGKLESPECVPETKLEAKMVEAMRQRATKGSIIRSFDSIILKFPKIDDSLRKCKTIFQKFGEYSVWFCSLECRFNYMVTYCHSIFEPQFKSSSFKP